jgi:succinylglutamate desuccinylase
MHMTMDAIEYALSRIVGRYGGTQPGPTMICVGGLHGNEPAGLDAQVRVLSRLEERNPTLRGEFLGLAGNLSALRQGQRFCEFDLNRAWFADRLELADGSHACAVEDLEQRELHRVLKREIGSSPDNVVVLDLHTTSGDSPPFALFADTLANRAFARHFQVPMVLGLEETIGGTMTDYLNEQGIVTMGFEAGRHQDPASVDLHEAAIWIALHSAGILNGALTDIVDISYGVLEAAAPPAPRVIEIRHRHAVSPGDGFVMEPGFNNLQPVRRGDLLAHDDRGRITAPMSGLLFMPLYQNLGEDGFFIARVVHPAWLMLSAVLRRSGLGRCPHLLPGIRRSASCSRTVVVNRNVARWVPRQLFHLLGYRCRSEDHRELIMVRRPGE